ncbi:MAG: hypothetical protein JW917_06430 [Ignavibacteria bacterium]|nr:hypothetical protein [Ignavibacteria bacterium]
MKSLIIKSLVLLSLIVLIIISVLNKSETDDSEKIKIEKQKEKKIKQEKEENKREILLNELSTLKSGNGNTESIDTIENVKDYLLMAEFYQFETEKTGNEASSEGFDFLLVDSSRGIFDVVDTSIYGNGEIVKYCRKSKLDGSINEGVILRKSVKLNENFGGKSFYNGKYKFDYYFLPRIRIDKIFASNPNNHDYPVCLITVTNSAGDTVIFQNLPVNAFYGEETFSYDGFYMTEFRFGGFLSELKILENKISSKKNKDVLFNVEIYYYGYCDMWIDFIRIENAVAHQFLTKQDASLIKEYEKYSGRDIFKQLYECN